MRTSAFLIATILGLVGFGCGDGDESPTRSTTGGQGGAAASTGGSNSKATGGSDSADDETGGSGAQPNPNGGDAGTGEEPGTGGSSSSAGSANEGDAGASAGGTPGAGGDSGGGDDALGFSVRAPEERSVTCTGVADPEVLYDEDFVCTFQHGEIDGYVYVQATPTDCQVLMGAVPTTFDAAGWISIDGVASPLEELAYDHGGNHFNNTFEFSYLGSRYRIAHSSIGFGGRSCQPPDCIQVYESDGATLVEDGCTVDRTLPVTCVAVESGGVVPELVDTFAPCPADPNYTEDTSGATRS